MDSIIIIVQFLMLMATGFGCLALIAWVALTGAIKWHDRCDRYWERRAKEAYEDSMSEPEAKTEEYDYYSELRAKEIFEDKH